VFADVALQFRFPAPFGMNRANRSTAFYHSEHNFFAAGPRDADFLLAALVHVPRFAADESLIDFNLSSQLVKPRVLHCQTNAVEHKPSRFLSDIQPAMQFIGTDAVLATDKEPRGTKPLLQRNRRVLKYSTRLERKRRLGMPRIAFPNALFRKPRELFCAARRARHLAVRPAQFDHELAAVLEIREPDNRVSKVFGERGAFHDSSMRRNSGFVKYVITLRRACWLAIL
jgi:hypothetical protein